MINIVVPLAGGSQYFNDAQYKFPRSLIEINGKTMIENFIDNFSQINSDKQFIFIVNSEDCRQYHLDSVLSLLTDNKCIVIKMNEDTKGAACTALMSIKYIDNNTPLIVANPDQVIDVDLNLVVNELSDSDAGVITFESIHPKWSYVLLDDDQFIIEVAEKKPLSKSAIAGFYFYKKGADFVSSAMSMIRKDSRINGSFYISLTFNELILKNKILKTFPIDSHKYHSFYSPKKIEEYERSRGKC